MRKHSIRVLLLAALAVSISGSAGAAKRVPVDLKCENLHNPLGVNSTAPRFSWKNTDGLKRQIAYEIAVGTDSAALASKGKADLWSSGKVSSGESVLVPYAGATLAPRTQAWWKVRTWDEKGAPSDWSGVARFGVGITGDAPEGMRGSYIGLAEADGDVRSPLLRKQFDVRGTGDGKVMCHVNSLGYHELYVNGRKVGENVLSPGVSQLGTRSLIVTYDITPYITEGENDMVVWLGQGWYKPTTYHAEYPGPVAKVEVDLVRGNASEPIVQSDATWMASASGYNDTDTWNALRFGGERVDGRTVPAGMSATELGARNWKPAAVVNITPHKITPEASDRNKIMKTNTAVATTRLPDGRIMADMGRVLTGWFELDIPRLPAGTEVKMEYSDYLTPDGTPELQGEADIYVAAGREGERFCNKFHHHAYRYVILNGLDDVPSPESCRAHQIHGDYADASSFECSDADLNAVHDMVKYTMKCLTFSGYMVDCPHIERTGYGGDGNSSTMTLQTMYDVAPTYTNWLQAWGDVIRPDGGLPHVAPAGGGGGGPYWCAFIALAPWRTWLNYGDEAMLSTYYPLMKQWMGYVDAYSPDGMLERWPDTDYRGWYLGDWLPPMGVDVGNQASIDLINNCVVSDCLDKMEKGALALGLSDEAAQWRAKRQALNAKIHYRFYNPATGEYATGSQIDMTYPMITGVVPEHLRDAVRKRTLELTAERCKGHIGTGLVGVPIVTQWSVDEHQPDFMAGMLRQHDYPGYLHMIDNGATATWEYWSGERSRVHNCYNGIGTWFYQGVGGIVPDPSAPGYRHFFVDPQLPEVLEWASVTKGTPYGDIAVRWDKVKDGTDYSITVPSGTSATFVVPEGMKMKKNMKIEQAGNQVILQPGVHKIQLQQEKM